MPSHRTPPPARRRLFALACLAAAFAAAPAAQAQDGAAWPSRPIRIVTPYAAGGPGDDTARLVGEALAKALGQAVVIDNKPGAGGIIGADAVAKAPADGHTLLAGANGTLVNSFIRPKMPYEAGDLVPVAGVSWVPSLIVVPPASPARTLKELQALGRQDKAGLLYATTGVGSTSHFTGELIKSSLGMPLAFVPYKGGAESVQALISGQVQLVADVPSAALVSLAKSGRVRPLAVASDRRLPALPDVPTTVEAGFPGVRMTHWLGLFAPKGTPAPVLDRIAAAVQAYTASDAGRKELAARNYEAMPGGRPAFARFVEGERQRLGRIAADLRIVAE